MTTWRGEGAAGNIAIDLIAASSFGARQRTPRKRGSATTAFVVYVSAYDRSCNDSLRLN
jgi:hypothetical protein